jgi:hypothetical protein
MGKEMKSRTMRKAVTANIIYQGNNKLRNNQYDA